MDVLSLTEVEMNRRLRSILAAAMLQATYRCPLTRRVIGLMTIGFASCLLAPVVQGQDVEQIVCPPPAGQFAVRLLLTDDVRKFDGRYKAGQPVTILGSTVHPLHPVRIAGLMSGCASDQDGLCNVTVKFTIYQADGSINSFAVTGGEPPSPNVPVLVGQPAPAAGHWHVKSLGPAIDFGYRPTLSDLGDYLLVAEFTDHNRSGTSRMAWRTVSLAESPKAREVRMEMAASKAPNVDFNPRPLNDLGYQAMYKLHDTKRALQYFIWNSILFSNEPDLIDSLAEGHLQAGNRVQALALYTKALQLKSDYTNAATAKAIVAKLSADPASLAGLQRQAREAYR